MTGLFLEEPRALGKERCRSKTSIAGGEGQRSFADGFGRKEQRFADVVSLEVWVQREDALSGLPSATRATTVATGIRRPRRHATPPIWRGFVVILLNPYRSVARRPLIRERPRSGDHIRQGHDPRSRAPMRP